MKTTIKISMLAVIFCLLGITALNAQTAATKKSETFKVYGNCEMCKDKIEGALKKKEGVLKKDWNEKTKMLNVTFDESKITLAQIKQKIADVGYDTDAVRAKDEVYNKLHKCCQYSRPK